MIKNNKVSVDKVRHILIQNTFIENSNNHSIYWCWGGSWTQFRIWENWRL